MAHFLPITLVLIIVYTAFLFSTLWCWWPIPVDMCSSLACGHLFGNSCIKRWLKQAGKKQGKVSRFLFYLIYYTSRSAQYFHVGTPYVQVNLAHMCSTCQWLLTDWWFITLFWYLWTERQQCPQCNRRARIEDLRTLYVPRLAVVDGDGQQYKQVSGFHFFDDTSSNLKQSLPRP